MTDWNLRIDLRPPTSASVSARRAAGALLGAWLTEDLPAGRPPGLIEHLDHTGAPVSLLVLDWLTGHDDPSAAAHACLDHLAQQIPLNPATVGWNVTAAAELVEDPGHLHGPDHGDPLPAMDGPVLVDQVRASAAHFTALTVEDLAQAFSDDDLGGQASALQMRALAGSLIVAATWVTDELLNDVATLTAGGTIEDTSQMVNLPPQFTPHYTPGFARQFLVAFLDLSARLTQDQCGSHSCAQAKWSPTSCVAQDLGMQLLLDQADVVADLAGMRLPEDWQITLAELLLEDIDHEYLYNPALDGFEDDPTFGPPGMASMRPQDWFDHKPDRPPLPPYLT